MITFTGTIPDPGKFRISTTSVDGRPQVFLECIPCRDYAYNVSSVHIRSLTIALCARAIALDVLLATAAIHECPAVVTDYINSKEA